MFSPLMHDESIVDGSAVDLIDTRGLEVFIKSFKGRALFRRTGRRESAGKRKDHNPLVAEEIARAHILPAEGVVTTNAFITHAGFKDNVGNLTSKIGRAHV